MVKPTTDTSGSSRVIEASGQRLLVVSSTEELKVVSSPQRQRIFQILQMADRPLHGKEIADSIGSKTPSAHFHLRKLEEIGAVRVSHTRNINGITATYYEPAVDGIITGEDFLSPADDSLTTEKLVLTSTVFDEAKRSFVKVLGKQLRREAADTDAEALAVLRNEILYLSKDDRLALCGEIEALLNRYTKPSPEKQSYSLLLSICGGEQADPTA